MARTHKKGLDYFSHDTDLFSDTKIKILKAKHGLIGYAVYLRLLEELYKEEGYFLKLDDDFKILFIDENGLDIDQFENILETCINRGLFNKDIFTKYGLLTSKRIQENYLHTTKRRDNITIIKNLVLIDVNKYCDNVDIINIDDYIKGINTNNGTHRIEENRIEENRIEYESIISYLNDKLGTSYKHTASKNKSLIDARINDGYTLNDFKKVIDTKYNEWNNTDMAKYLRPETLFSNKFESYLNQIVVKDSKQEQEVIQITGIEECEYE